MDKLALREKMMALTEAEMAQAHAKYESFLASARLDRSETIENDEQAQAERAADLAEAFDDRAHQHAEKLATLKRVDFRPKAEVGLGAVIELGDRYLVISVSTAEFECQGKRFIGISPNAPIFGAMEGKKEGEMCEFNGRELNIGAIY